MKETKKMLGQLGFSRSRHAGVWDAFGNYERRAQIVIGSDGVVHLGLWDDAVDEDPQKSWRFSSEKEFQKNLGDFQETIESWLLGPRVDVPETSAWTLVSSDQRRRASWRHETGATLEVGVQTSDDEADDVAFSWENPGPGLRPVEANLSVDATEGLGELSLQALSFGDRLVAMSRRQLQDLEDDGDPGTMLALFEESSRLG